MHMVKPKHSPHSTRLHNPHLAVWLLRIGLALVFVYAGEQSLAHPQEWIGYLPKFALDHFDAHLMLKGLAVSQLLLAGWLLIGKYLKLAAGASALMLLGVIFANFGPGLYVTFRDVGLLLMAVALIFAE